MNVLELSKEHNQGSIVVSPGEQSQLDLANIPYQATTENPGQQNLVMKLIASGVEIPDNLDTDLFGDRWQPKPFQIAAISNAVRSEIERQLVVDDSNANPLEFSGFLAPDFSRQGGTSDQSDDSLGAENKTENNPENKSEPSAVSFAINNLAALDAINQLALNQAILLMQDALGAIASQPTFLSILKLAFGENFNTKKAETLRQQWLNQTFDSLPTIEIRPAADINQARGAFSTTTGRIYLSQEYIVRNAATPKVIANLLLEEFGHFVDTQINTTDAAGDEGAIFATLVQGKTLDETTLQTLKAENDQAVITLDGQQIHIEQANNQVTLSGTILWKDSQRKTHPVRESTVKIWDDDGGAGRKLVTTVKTDQAGRYTATFDNDDGWLQGKRDIFIEVLADGPTHFVEGSGSKFSTTYSAETATVLHEISDGAHTLSLTIDRGDATEHAFSVSDALYVGSIYANTVRGKPSNVEANFTADGSYFSHGILDQDINILSKDRWDWDVILHEYGHFLAKEDHLADSPGGDHKAGESNISKLGKDTGVRLAWSEGLATYLGIAAQHVAKAAGQLPNILNAGDTKYTDTLDSTLFYDLEIEGSPDSQGEGDELSVARILWDLADSTQDAFDLNAGRSINGLKDEIALGHQGLYTLIKTIPNLDRLDDLWDHIYNTNLQDRQRATYGAIFEEYNVSPSPTLQAKRNVFNKFYILGSPPPTFTWEKGNNGANDQFKPFIFDTNFERVASSGNQLKNVTSWTPTQQQWDKITRNPGEYNFVITGSDTDNGPQTGQYWSGAYKFQVLPVLSDWFLTPFPPFNDLFDPGNKLSGETPLLPGNATDSLIGQSEKPNLVGEIKEDALTAPSTDSQTPVLEPILETNASLTGTASNLIPKDLQTDVISLGMVERTLDSRLSNLGGVLGGADSGLSVSHPQDFSTTAVSDIFSSSLSSASGTASATG